MPATLGTQREIDCFLANVEQAARNAQVTLKQCDADYDRLELFRPTGRVDTRRVLIAIRARGRLEFPIPLRCLPDGAWTSFHHPDARGADGLWLHLPGDDEDDPLDVLACCFDEDDCLMQFLFSEVLSEKPFAADVAWQEMKLTYRPTFDPRGTAQGLCCVMTVDIEGG